MDFVMMGWIAVAGLGLAAALGAAVVALFPPLPRDLGGAPDLDAEAEPVRIPVPGDGELNAWVIPGWRPAVIVLFHGFGRTHHRAWRYAGFLRHLGAHLVTVDFRSSRSWGRRPTTLGLYEVEDAATVLDWVVRSPRFAGCSIGIHGESLGAAVALDLAARRPEVAAVVADGAFARASKAIEDSCERWARMPRQPSATILRTLGRVVTGHDPATFAPVETLSALADRPVFFIHGTRDDRIGTEQAWALWRAAGAKDRLWIVAGAGHNEAWHHERAEYERCVSAFFACGLLGDVEVVPAGGREATTVEAPAAAAPAGERASTPVDAPAAVVSIARA